MKKLLFSILIVLSSCLLFAQEKERHLMLFTCQYGAGHKMATQGIVEALPNDEIQVVDIYKEPLASLDLMRSLAYELSCESFYNQAIKKEWNPLLNSVGCLAQKVFILHETRMYELLLEYISAKKPDMLISCVPLVNSALLRVADELNLPLLVVTTDIDVSAFCLGLPDDLEIDQDHFRITLPYEKEPWDTLFKEKFSPAVQGCFHYAFGYPTRRAFSEEPSVTVLNQLREYYQIQKDEQVVLVMMGGNAGRASEGYASLLLKMSDETLDRVVGKESRLHLICLCGDASQSENRAFIEKLNALNKKASRVRIHAVPATSQIAELVSLPELCLVISKPGGSTVNEMIKKRVFMIYHTSSFPLDWERGNIAYGELRGYGKQFILSKQTPTEFTELLIEAFAKGRSMRSLETLVPEAKIDFAHSFEQSVHQMLEKKERIKKNKE